MPALAAANKLVNNVASGAVCHSPRLIMVSLHGARDSEATRRHASHGHCVRTRVDRRGAEATTPVRVPRRQVGIIEGEPHEGGIRCDDSKPVVQQVLDLSATVRGTQHAER